MQTFVSFVLHAKQRSVRTEKLGKERHYVCGCAALSRFMTLLQHSLFEMRTFIRRRLSMRPVKVPRDILKWRLNLMPSQGIRRETRLKLGLFCHPLYLVVLSAWEIDGTACAFCPFADLEALCCSHNAARFLLPFSACAQEQNPKSVPTTARQNLQKTGTLNSGESVKCFLQEKICPENTGPIFLEMTG